jgi:Na+-driven multidrug efflux pump
MLAAVIGALFMLIPKPLLALFGMVDPDVAGLGTELLRYLSISGLFIVVALVYTGGLQGSGDTRSPLYITLISQIVIPLGMCGVLQSTRGLRPSDVWLAIVIGHATRCALSVLRFRQGRWRSIKVEIGTVRPPPDELEPDRFKKQITPMDKNVPKIIMAK